MGSAGWIILFVALGLFVLRLGVFQGEPNFNRFPVTIRRWKVGTLQTIEIHRDRVRVAERGLFAGNWEEPLSAFIGVLRQAHREMWVGGSYGAGGFAVTIYPVSLVHPDGSKTLKLSDGRGTEASYKLWQDAARVLDLPALGDAAREIAVDHSRVAEIETRAKEIRAKHLRGDLE